MKKILTVILFFLYCYMDLYPQFTQTVVSIGGRVYNITNHKPLSVNIEVYNQNGKRINKVKSNLLDGSYFITGLKPGTINEIRFSDFDYMKYSYTMQIPPTDKYLEYSKDFLIIPKKVQTKVQIPLKLFETRKSNLKVGVDQFLVDYINLLKFNPTVKIRIVSYPDDNSNTPENLSLTQERSNSIRDFFIANGIDGSRVQTQGSQAIDPNNPLPSGKASKGKRYIGSSYLVIESF